MKMFYFGQTSAVYAYHSNATAFFFSHSHVFLSISSSLSVCIEGSLTGGSVD